MIIEDPLLDLFDLVIVIISSNVGLIAAIKPQNLCEDLVLPTRPVAYQIRPGGGGNLELWSFHLNLQIYLEKFYLQKNSFKTKNLK